MMIKIMKMIEIVMIKIKNVMKRDNKYECEYNDNNEDECEYIRDNNENKYIRDNNEDENIRDNEDENNDNNEDENSVYWCILVYIGVNIGLVSINPGSLN